MERRGEMAGSILSTLSQMVSCAEQASLSRPLVPDSTLDLKYLKIPELELESGLWGAKKSSEQPLLCLQFDPWHSVLLCASGWTELTLQPTLASDSGHSSYHSFLTPQSQA